ncbi:MAG: hypothetical protein EP315_09080 [Gammaproteobacteria bacterium]|nr:MAG: hypothetical protein EP315_09080 [Gammaproteobacteria bacterium]
MPLHHIPREFTPMGITVALSGVVAVVGVEGFKRILKLGDMLNEGDTVVTGDEGGITIGFADGSHLDVGHDSELTVNADLFDPATFKGDFASQLQEMRDAISGGQAADAVLEAAAHWRLHQPK